MKIERLNSWNPLSVYITSGSGEDNKPACQLAIYAFRRAVYIDLPQLFQPIAEKVVPNWDAATVARLGRDFYWDYTERRYGFMLNEGHLMVYRGARTDDSSTDYTWSCFLPWTQWRHVRLSLYDLHGAHYATEQRRRAGELDDEPFGSFRAWQATVEECPKRSFRFRDFDGEEITATTHIEEREWLRGEKWCSWLSLFYAPKVRRSLSIEFSAEVGPMKGSWKGGTLGHGIDMQPGELHEAAFRRYCKEQGLTFLAGV